MSRPSGTAPTAPPTHLSLIALSALCALIYGFLVAVPQVQGVPPHMALYGGSLLLAVLSLALIGVGAIWRSTPLDECVLAASFLVLWVLGARAAQFGDVGKLYVGPAADVSFLLACLCLGKLLSRIVRERAMTLPVCVVAGLADVFTVFFGPTGQALEKVPELVKKLSLAVPQAGSAAGPEGVRGLAHVASMGLGDFIFLALFMALAVRYAFPAGRTFVAVVAAACAGIVLALAVNIPMPLLPYMATGFILANARQFRLSPQERRDLLIALGVLVAVLAVAAVALRL